MRLKTLLAETDYSVLRGSVEDVLIEGIEYNTSSVGDGDLFVCMKGARVDGHFFADKAYASGCRAFLTERLIAELPDDAVQIKVENTRRELARISAIFRGHPARKLKIIGITGTKGKTTTALLVHSILNGAGIPCAYIGSNGVIIKGKTTATPNTTPESAELQRFFQKAVDEGITHVALEVSSQALDRFRVFGIDFDTTVFTNLYRDHIGTGEHASFEEYKAAKAKLFSEYKKELIVYNADDPFSSDIISGDRTTPRVSFSASSDEAVYYATDIKPFRDPSSLGVSFICRHGGEGVAVKLKSPGEFSVHNALCAIAVVGKYGVSPEKAAQLLKDVTVTGRFEIVEGLPGRTFVIDYAHNGISLQSALSVLRTYDPNRIICVFGSVGGRTFERREELARVACRLADHSIITSDNPDFEPASDITEQIASYFDRGSSFEIIPDREDAVRRAVRIAKDGDVVLFAGKGHERYQLIAGERVPFCERDIILDECRAVTADEMRSRL